MIQNNFHGQIINNKSELLSPPPARLLPVLEKAKVVYKKWMEMHRNIERTARFSIGTRIDNSLLDILELLRRAVYTPIDKKIILLNEASIKIDTSRFFLQILWETKLISSKQYISIETDIQDLGRIIGGWKKGLVIKTSTEKAEERKQ
ncbi:MAG: four helix bundle protein [Candidatus Staskawiczbacteria bacterium]|nr:four helix bundle protein [Candidatus Staskawiczbacteria bacterium]